MNLAERAFSGLFPDKDPKEYRFLMKYSGRFSDFNANVRKCGNRISFGLSRRWQEVDTEIQLGLIQELMGKVFKLRKTTPSIRLYHIFIKNVYLAATKKKSHPSLIEAFNRLNKTYFFESMDMPNMRFGKASMVTLGSYNYHTDTVTISRILKDADNTSVIEYVLYHELLHKKLKFKNKSGRAYHHTSEFRKREMQFPDHKKIEKSISGIILAHKKTLKKGVFGIFGW